MNFGGLQSIISPDGLRSSTPATKHGARLRLPELLVSSSSNLSLHAYYFFFSNSIYYSLVYAFVPVIIYHLFDFSKVVMYR